MFTKRLSSLPLSFRYSSLSLFSIPRSWLTPPRWPPGPPHSPAHSTMCTALNPSCVYHRVAAHVIQDIVGERERVICFYSTGVGDDANGVDWVWGGAGGMGTGVVGGVGGLRERVSHGFAPARRVHTNAHMYACAFTPTFCDRDYS